MATMKRHDARFDRLSTDVFFVYVGILIKNYGLKNDDNDKIQANRNAAHLLIS